MATYGGSAGFSLSRKKMEDAIVPYESVPKLVYLWAAYGKQITGGTGKDHLDQTTHMVYINQLWKLYVTLCKKLFDSPEKVAKIQHYASYFKYWGYWADEAYDLSKKIGKSWSEEEIILLEECIEHNSLTLKSVFNN